MFNKIKSAVWLLRRIYSANSTTRVRALLSLVHVHRYFRRPSSRFWLHRKLRKSFSIYINPECQYGKNLCIKHPVGVVIGSGVSIGDNVTLYQNTTLGGRRMGDGGGTKYPSIGNNVVVFAGAVILGDIRIGNNAVIGANAVVLSDVPDNATAVGVPARVIQPHISNTLLSE